MNIRASRKTSIRSLNLSLLWGMRNGAFTYSESLKERGFHFQLLKKRRRK